MSTHIKVLGARYEYDQPERNVLTDNQINYVRKMPEALGGTYALWEQLTLYRRQSTLRNINVSATGGRVLELAASRAKWVDVRAGWRRPHAPRLCGRAVS